MDYPEYLRGLGLTEQTIRIYAARVAHAETWMTRHTYTTLKWAGASELRAYTATLPDTHSTLRQVVAALTHYWHQHGRYDAPVKAIRVPPQPEMVCQAVTVEEARALHETALGWWPHGGAVLCGLYLALRRFEIAKMEWDRFTLDGAWYRVTGKYSKTATIPNHAVLWAELAPHKAGRWVFPGRWDGPVTAATIWQWTKEVGRAAGIPDLRTHQLRHTALATAHDETENIRSVKTFARHAKLSTTAGYTRTTATRLREVSDALNYT